jgi:hypothetical protein
MLSDFSHSAMPSMGFKAPFFFFSFLIICCAVLFKLLVRKPEKA